MIVTGSYQKWKLMDFYEQSGYSRSVVVSTVVCEEASEKMSSELWIDPVSRGVLTHSIRVDVWLRIPVRFYAKWYWLKDRVSE